MEAINMHFEGKSFDLVYNPTGNGCKAMIVHDSHTAFQVMDTFVSKTPEAPESEEHALKAADDDAIKAVMNLTT